MRSDISRILVERPRTGGDVTLKRRARRRLNDVRNFDAPTNASGRSLYSRMPGDGLKSLSDNLAPLWRFLRKSIGRPWADVYSEIREHISPDSTMQMHIVQHLRSAVENDIVMDADTGKPLRPRSYSGGSGLGRHYTDYTRYSDNYGFYVHPINGTLARAPWDNNHGPNRKKPVVNPIKGGADFDGRSGIIEGRNVYFKDGGMWYEADMRPLPSGIGWGVPGVKTVTQREWGTGPDGKRCVVTTARRVPDTGPRDFLRGMSVGERQPVFYRSGPEARARIGIQKAKAFYGRADAYCHGKGRQLDTKTLKRLGVTNN